MLEVPPFLSPQVLVSRLGRLPPEPPNSYKTENNQSFELYCTRFCTVSTILYCTVQYRYCTITAVLKLKVKDRIF